MAVAEVDESGTPVAGEHIGFKLQRAVKSHNKWSWSAVAQAEGDDGAAGTPYTPKSGPGLYLVTATASPLPATCASPSAAAAPTARPRSSPARAAVAHHQPPPL